MSDPLAFMISKDIISYLSIWHIIEEYNYRVGQFDLSKNE